MPKPHQMFEVTTASEVVAYCQSDYAKGVDLGPLATKLQKAAALPPLLAAKPPSLVVVWDTLSEDEQTKLNALAEAVRWHPDKPEA